MDTTVVAIDFRHNILNYNYLWLKSQLLPIMIIDSNDYVYNDYDYSN